MAGDGRQRPALARTADAARAVEVLARQVGARPRTVPGRPPGNRRDVALVRRPPMARAGVPRGTRDAVVPRCARVMGPAGRPARPPETDGGGPVGPPRAARSIAAAGPRLAVSLGVTGSLGASIAAAPGPRTTAGFVLRPAARPAKAPVPAPHRVAGPAARRREATAATLRRVATSVAPGSQPTPDHGRPLPVTPGEARGPWAALRGPRPAQQRPGQIRIAHVRDQRAKGRPLVMAAVTGHRGQPAVGPATAGQVTPAAAMPGQAPGAGTRHGLAAGARTRPRPAVAQSPTRPGRRFPIRSAPSSSSLKRGLS